MKFSLFTEIQCPAGSRPVERIEEFLAQAELADQLGYRGFWIAEIHFQPRFSVLSAPYTVLAAAAQRTGRLRLGVAVNTLPVHHPVQIAEQAALLDLLSRGRMDFAAGGGHPHSRVYECFGADHKSTHEVMEESLAVIRKAWTEEVLSFEGRYFRIPEVTVNPKPLQEPPPPFHIAASSPEGVEIAAKLGLNLFLPIHTRTPEQVVDLAGAYWSGLKRHGHAAREKELGLLVPLHVAPTVEEAEERARDGIMGYYRTIGDMRDDYVEWLTRRGMELPERVLKTARGRSLPFDAVCRRHAVVGSPASTAAALGELAAKTGASHFLVWMNIGGTPQGHVLDSMRRFALEVMPGFGA